MIRFTFLILTLLAQSGERMPPVGIIDFYGLRLVSESEARQALQFKEGDLLPENSKAMRQRLEALTGVVEARLNLACCEAGKTILYVGVREKGTPALRFRAAPKGKARLPDYVAQVGEEYSKALTEAILKGEVGEDAPTGHALSRNARVRAIQENFVEIAEKEMARLRDVLHNSNDPDNRALAAQVIAYARNKQLVIPDLVKAMRDSSGNVRNNSMRALWVMAKYAAQSPDSSIRIDPQPFIDMLRSIEWSDRNKASLALLEITKWREVSVLAKLRRRALDSLLEMARWKAPGHASAPFFILGRIGGFTDNDILMRWDSGDREALIEAVLKRARSN